MDERSFAAAQQFLLAAKLFWTHALYGQVKQEFAAARAAQPVATETPATVASVFADNTTYRFFAWFERHLQAHKYSGRYGLVPYMNERRADLLKTFCDTDQHLLSLDPALAMPSYYQAVDFHQHPGGVGSDEIAGHVYERGARTTTPTLGAQHADLHERFTALACARQKPDRVLDLGCGFGKSTGPFAQTLPDATIVGVDLSVPCLRLAAHTAAQRQLRNVRYAQADACATAEPSDSYDLVTSTMLLHELPPKAVEGVFREAYRVLQNGGRMIHLDFYEVPDAFDRFIHFGHGARNNEPYMEPLVKTDLRAMLARNGFTDVEIAPFAETDAQNDGWRFPWTVIAARKA